VKITNVTTLDSPNLSPGREWTEGPVCKCAVNALWTLGSMVITDHILTDTLDYVYHVALGKWSRPAMEIRTTETGLEIYRTAIKCTQTYTIKTTRK